MTDLGEIKIRGKNETNFNLELRIRVGFKRRSLDKSCETTYK